MSDSVTMNCRDGDKRGKGVVWFLSLLLMASFILAPKLGFSSVQRDVIVNTAVFSSNSVKLADASVSTTIVVRTPATIEYLKYAPQYPSADMVNVSTTKYLDSTGSYAPMPAPVPVGSTSPLDITTPIPLIKADVYHEGEPIFLRLTDGDQNIDPSVAETVVLTLNIKKNSEKETLILTETGQDTGVFVGYIQSVVGSTAAGSANIDNGKLSVYEDAKILATYEDDQDGIATYEATALVDPFGVVFDTSNGQPVNGATVTLMDMATGKPAAVFGDDGVSSYPSTVMTGGTATDSSGVVYTFSPGGYRFPFISSGKYRLDVVPPATYRSPSTVSTADIQNLPGAPFAIVEPGSRGKEFYINPGPAIHIDLPADPIQSSLYVTKAAGKSLASIGDFLQYKVTVENPAAIAVNSVQVADTLPLGFRYRKGSAKANGSSAADPSVSGDGKTLVFNIGTLAAGKTADITYVVEIAARATSGKAVNTAAASGAGGAVSNTARAEVLVREELFGGKGIIMGRVFPGGCDGDQNGDGVGGVRIYLENGTYVVTDKKGMFHFEGVKPGTHVVQLDLVTMPEDYELVSCEENDRYAGTPYSQFVDLQGGTMWRADFYLAPKPKEEDPKEEYPKEEYPKEEYPKEEPKAVEIKGEVGIELLSVLKSATGQEKGTQHTEIVLHPHFESGSAILSPGDKSELDRVANEIKGLYIERMEVVGHTDSQRISRRLRSLYPDNYALSMARAGSVAEYLISSMELDPSKVIIDGKGPDEPVADNNTPAGMAMNRRVELKVAAKAADGAVKPKGEVDYELFIHVGDVPVSNLRASIILPEGVEHKNGSSTLGDAALPDPEITENILTYRIGDEREGWEGRIRLSADVALDGKDDDLTTKAFLTFDSPEDKDRQTPLVENAMLRKNKERLPDIVLHPHFDVIKADLKKEDTVVLDGIISELRKARVVGIRVTGHTDSTPIAQRSQHIFADNYALSIARAKSVADYIAGGLVLSPSQVAVDGKGPDEPVSSNKTAEGRALNRRVELDVYKDTVALSELRNEKDKSGLKEVEIKAVRFEEAPAVEKKDDPKTAEIKIKEKEGILSPADTASLATQICAVRVCLASALKPRLLLDGKEVPSGRIGFTMSEKESGKTIYSYIGIDFGDAGDHVLLLQGVDPFGNVRFEDKAAVTRTGEIASIRLLSTEGNVADGKTPVKIRLQFLDASGKTVNASAQLEIKDGNLIPPAKDPAVAPAEKTTFVQVDADGWATFQPVANSGPYRAVLAYNNVKLTVETYVKPEMRDWILVGLAEGTAGYNTVSGNMESLKGSDVEDKYYKDGRLAFFAKGMIKGKWLLTMAFDSEKKGIRNNDSLHGIIDPDNYYMLYGDATQQGYEAASARALYVKIERDGFYALFGDYDTGLTVTELSRYTRNFNGFKSEMKGDRLDFKVFASDTNQAFVKDEIRGDGTSGLYKLSRKNIVINSESVTIETRDRFRSEAIISSQKLSRHIEYNIDYDAGTIYFKSPVYSRDENLNPIYIVVDYESFDPTDVSFNYGGRGAARFLENKLEIGATHVHEGRTGGKGDMFGTDAAFQLDDKTKLRAEFAQTNTDFNNVSSNGNAYLAELSHRSEKVEGKVYVREQEKEFGLGQQNGSESGTRKIGMDGTYRLDEKVSFRTEIYRQYNLSTDAVRDMAEAQARYNEKQYEVHGGLRHAEDTFDNGDVNNSEQLTAGGSYRMMNDRLVLRLEHDRSLATSNENSDFPTRTTLGADFKLNDTATLFVSQEFTQGENEDTRTTRIGMKASPWSGGQISSTLEQQYTENGARVFSVTGLKQTWHVTKKWRVDAGLDRSETLKHPGNNAFNANVPAASGGADFTAASLGAAYKEEKWGWTGRIERRESDNEEKTGLFTGVYGEVREGVALAAAIQAFITDSETTDKKSGDLRFGLAYRPKETKWIVLDRLDYIFDEQQGTGFDYDNWRVVNNMNLNYKPSRKAQISLQYGAKYVAETIDDRDYSGYTDLFGLEGRYDITKKWDTGLRGNVLHSWEVGQYKYGYGPSVGYNFAKNIWLSVGYNLEGFRDRDFSRADFTAEGPYVKFRMKFDQGTVKDAVKWFSGQ